MDGAEIDALIDALEAASAWSEDTTAPVAVLLADIPETPQTRVRRARLILLSVQHLIGDRGPAETARMVLEIRAGALDRGDRALQAQAEHALADLFLSIREPSAALGHAVTALTLDDDTLDPALRCRLHLTVADALAMCGSMVDARPHYRRALEHARPLRSPPRALRVLNNWACGEVEAREPGTAWTLVEEMRSLAAEHGARLPLAPTGTVAEVLHALGRSDEAVTMLLDRLRDDTASVTPNVVASWLALAWIELDRGDLDAAQEALATVQHRAVAGNLHGLQVEALGLRAELLAARGDHAGAYETHLRFHQQTLALSSGASEARARTLHAMHQVGLARREGARYREMSYRDALTGLLNRRHVDEDLDARLARGEPLGVAMVDLDRFKAVNDTFSHEAGDAVLVRVAGILEETAAARAQAYAARLGGEEFLLVLPGADLDQAYEIAEGLRRSIAATDWSDLSPGLPVTASTGLAATTGATRPPPDRPDLLRRADRHLRAAKTGGRDRVEPLTGGLTGASDARAAVRR